MPDQVPDSKSPVRLIPGQLRAGMIDDDPASSNNQSGLFGIELEAITKVSVRNMWVKKPLLIRCYGLRPPASFISSSSVHGRLRPAERARTAFTVSASTGVAACPHSRRT